MSYLLDRKSKNKKFGRIIITVIILFLIINFRAPIVAGLSSASHFIITPILRIGNNIGDKFENIGSIFYSKKVLLKENEILQAQLDERGSMISNYNSVLDENVKMKEILGRKNPESEIVLSAILSKPNRSPYDTLIIDTGEDQGITSGDKVFALGNIPIGHVADVYQNSAKVILFSTPLEKTEVVISGGDIFMQLVGRGGGNFEMILPRDFVLEKGTEVHLPGITPYVVAIAETIISDPRDSFSKAILVSPVNIQELKFVQVQK